MKKSKLHCVLAAGIMLTAVVMVSCASVTSDATQVTVADDTDEVTEENQMEAENQTEENTEHTDDGIFETAQSALLNIGSGWNLGNALDCYGDWISGAAGGKITGWETAWGNPVITKELIAAVKNAGFGAVRVPVTWRDHLDASGNVDTAWMAHVTEVVDWVLAEGLYCVINVHHDNGGDDGAWLVADRARFEGGMAQKYKTLWGQIATNFKDYGEKLLFGGLNETLDAAHNWNGSTSAAYEVINDLNQLFVTTVRATGGNNAYRNLIVQTYGASSAESQVSGFSKPADTDQNHLIAEVHIYDPSGFCGGADFTWDKEDEKALDTIFARLNQKIVSTESGLGLPLVVGEFGSQDHTKTAEEAAALATERAKYAAYFVKKARSLNAACFWWDDGGEMSLFDRTTASATQSGIIAELVR